MKVIDVDSEEFSNLRGFLSARDQKTHLDSASDISVFWKRGLGDVRGEPSAGL